MYCTEIHLIAQREQLALNLVKIRARIFASQADNRTFLFNLDLWTSTAVQRLECPFPQYKVSMPLQQGVWLDHSTQPNRAVKTLGYTPEWMRHLPQPGLGSHPKGKGKILEIPITAASSGALRNFTLRGRILQNIVRRKQWGMYLPLIQEYVEYGSHALLSMRFLSHHR